MDLRGNVVKLANAKHVGIDWFVDRIKETGIAVIIAGDKTRAGDTVSKLAAIFNAQSYAPKYDISVSRKRYLADGVAMVENAHQRDALAAAKTAFNAYSSKFMHAEKIANKKNYSDIDRIKALMITRHSIHEIVMNKKSSRYRNRFI